MVQATRISILDRQSGPIRWRRYIPARGIPPVLPADSPLRRTAHLVALLSIVVLTVGCRRGPKPKVEFTLEKVAFQVGDTKVRAHVTECGESRLTMIALHEDEQTSQVAAQTILEKHGGRLIQLVHSGNRRVTCSTNGAVFTFDPNRIFSSSGVAATVRGDGIVPSETHAIVSNFAEQFIDYFALRKERCLIALHNNGEGGLAISSYLPGGPAANDTEQVFANPKADPDNFFYVTDSRFFRSLAELKFNVMLQNNATVHDDGSLSVFAGRNGIPYINVEAQDGQLKEQIAMLDAAIGACRGLSR
jgi:hypothetical protein